MASWRVSTSFLSSRQDGRNFSEGNLYAATSGQPKYNIWLCSWCNILCNSFSKFSTGHGRLARWFRWSACDEVKRRRKGHLRHSSFSNTSVVASPKSPGEPPILGFWKHTKHFFPNFPDIVTSSCTRYECLIDATDHTSASVDLSPVTDKVW